MSIEDNVQASQSAEELFDFLSEDAKDENDFYKIAFWARMSKLVCSKLPKTPPKVEPGAFTDDEARKFELETMVYGEYAGNPVLEVPPPRIAWLLENKFQRKLVKYSKSDRFKQRLRDWERANEPRED